MKKVILAFAGTMCNNQNLPLHTKIDCDEFEKPKKILDWHNPKYKVFEEPKSKFIPNRKRK